MAIISSKTIYFRILLISLFFFLVNYTSATCASCCSTGECSAAYRSQPGICCGTRTSDLFGAPQSFCCPYPQAMCLKGNRGQFRCLAVSEADTVTRANGSSDNRVNTSGGVGVGVVEGVANQDVNRNSVRDATHPNTNPEISTLAKTPLITTNPLPNNPNTLSNANPQNNRYHIPSDSSSVKTPYTQDIPSPQQLRRQLRPSNSNSKSSSDKVAPVLVLFVVLGVVLGLAICWFLCGRLTKVLRKREIDRELEGREEVMVCLGEDEGGYNEGGYNNNRIGRSSSTGVGDGSGVGVGGSVGTGRGGHFYEYNTGTNTRGLNGYMHSTNYKQGNNVSVSGVNKESTNIGNTRRNIPKDKNIHSNIEEEKDNTKHVSSNLNNFGDGKYINNISNDNKGNNSLGKNIENKDMDIGVDRSISTGTTSTTRNRKNLNANNGSVNGVGVGVGNGVGVGEGVGARYKPAYTDNNYSNDCRLEPKYNPNSHVLYGNHINDMITELHSQQF